MLQESSTLAYIVGVALGDGNLSCPNRRVTRLRITCDIKYPQIIAEVITNLQEIFPKNKVSIVKDKKGECIDISVYSNNLNYLMPWQADMGSKMVQQAHVPKWIMNDEQYIKSALKGLVQTDGSIYLDRGYKMVNFTNVVKPLIEDVMNMMQLLGFKPRLSKTMQKSGNIKYTVRLVRDAEKFITLINLVKK
jgi:hypothetical protein